VSGTEGVKKWTLIKSN